MYDDLASRIGAEDADAWLEGRELPSKIARRQQAEEGLAALAQAQG